MNLNQYRADIDGLRCIAVLSVLIHHLSATLLPGGFVGVDIFFVISGYLITLQVYKEVRDRAFSIRLFYKRRINRIVPALVLVVATTYVLGALLLSPSDLIKFGKSAISAILGLSNVFFWREYGNYFAGNAAEAPLLHTWSLGVEEQFYVVWPLLIILLGKLRPKLMAIALVLLTISALVVSEVGVNMVASASYYLLPTRFFELMIGGLLALYISHNGAVSKPVSTLSFAVGMGLIGWALFFLNSTSSFPGINAVWPCLGAALIILSGTNPQSSARVLANTPMVFIGLISYSLYLWHWPIIAYLNYRNIPISPVIGLGVLLLSIALAWLSWKFVEVPMRQSGAPLSFPRVFLKRFSLPLVGVLSIGAVIAVTGGLPQRFDSRVVQYEVAVNAKPDLLRSGCHVPTAMYRVPPNDKCRLGTEKADLDGVLIGDSYANHFSGTVDTMAKAEGLAFMDYTMDGCLPIFEYAPEKGGAYAERCTKRNEAAYALVTKNHYARVILAASWPDDKLAGEHLAKSIELILKAGSKLTVILANEHIQRATSCPVRSLMYGVAENCSAAMSPPPAYFAEIIARFPGVHFLNPNSVICPHGTCNPVLDNTPLYRDDGHLNDVGARLIGQYLIKMNEKI